MSALPKPEPGKEYLMTYRINDYEETQSVIITCSSEGYLEAVCDQWLRVYIEPALTISIVSVAELKR